MAAVDVPPPPGHLADSLPPCALRSSEQAKQGITVCATIHSPTPFSFNQCDRIMILIAGRVAYFGRSGSQVGGLVHALWVPSCKTILDQVGGLVGTRSGGGGSSGGGSSSSGGSGSSGSGGSGSSGSGSSLAAAEGTTAAAAAGVDSDQQP